jgi:outer membrane receptor protein involved in Fe transport
MVYYTFSQGFRPGGFNQNGGVFAYAPGPDAVPQFATPKAYSSDKLTNNEIGWKTEFFDHRLQWNGAIYQENWDNVQVSFFDPGVTGNIFFDTNGQNFRIRGIETSLVGRVTNGLTLRGSIAWNQSVQTNSPSLIDNNPASANFGKPIAQAGLTTSRLRFENPAYSTYAASFGVSKDAWNVTVYGENLSNSNASTFISDDQFIVAQTPIRPRIIGLAFGYKF